MRWLGFLLLVLLVAPGCKEHGSIVPLADDDNSIVQDELVGDWEPADAKQQGKTRFHIFKRERNGYLLNVENVKEDKTLELEMVPLVVGKYRFLQLQRKPFTTKEENAGLLRVCYFARYDVSGDDFYVAFASTGVIKQLMEEHDLPMLDSDNTLLYTGMREPMLAFLEEHAEELYPKFKESGLLRRITGDDAAGNAP
ncbi:hypothetical protein [Blastopirellula marina]|uniref:Uncharacterized protein n=1 Tax=Blastopirellula marina TaxID=124 RepID=A0A2S8GMB0_9BACT|nr:hypothetical protein [Blastopirellula marina]PQO45576.1 hypothetical protein C5Y93_14140 [Blastopirellula marina]